VVKLQLVEDSLTSRIINMKPVR